MDDEISTIVALLHDLCKINTYKVDFRNKKDETGTWVKEPYYTIDDLMPLGHGEKSVMLISEFIKLSKEELDSLYIAKTNMLYILNMIRSGDMNKVALENALEILRKKTYG